MAENTTYTLTHNKSEGVKFAQGLVVFDATTITATDYVEIDVGFTPTYVKWVNVTDRIEIEWYNGMTANTCLKRAAAGTGTLETTNGGITVTGRSFRVLQNATLAAILASKTCAFIAYQ